MRNQILGFLALVLALAGFFFGRSCGPEKVRLDDFDGRLSALEADVSTTKVVMEVAAVEAAVANAAANRAEGSVATFGEAVGLIGEKVISSSTRLEEAEARLARVTGAIAAERAARQAAVAQLAAASASPPVSVPVSPPATIALAPPASRSIPAPTRASATMAPPSSGDDESENDSENDSENNLRISGNCWSASTTNLGGEDATSVLTKVAGGGPLGCFLTKDAAIAAACGGATGRLVSSGDGVDVVECDRPPPK